MEIALFGNSFAEHFKKYIQHLVKKLEKEKIKISIEKKFYDYLKNIIRFNNPVNIFSSHNDLNESIVFESNMVIGDVINPFEFLINSDWLSVDEIPQEFLITSVYPNPFNPSVSIEYNVIEISNIAFNFFDITGNLIDSKNIGYTSPGNYKFFWENKNIPSGTYFIVMTDGISKNIRKITLVK